MKKLMILGAGYTQLPLVRAAKKRGCHTLVASIPGDYDAFTEADECVYVDISKPEEVLVAAKAAGLSDCPVNCDLVYTEEGAKVIEVTGRSGATGLSEMVGALYGIDYYDAIAALAMGENVKDLFSYPRDLAVKTATLTSPTDGILESISFDETLADHIFFNCVKGDTVRRYTNGRDRIGEVMISAGNEKELEEKWRAFEKSLVVDVSK